MRCDYFHIMNPTKIIETYFFQNDLKKNKVATELKFSQQNFQKKFNSNHLGTDFIILLSKHFNHNFFADLAKELDIELSKNNEIDLLEHLKLPTKKLSKSELETHFEEFISKQIEKKLENATRNFDEEKKNKESIKKLEIQLIEIKKHIVDKDDEIKRLKSPNKRISSKS